MRYTPTFPRRLNAPPQPPPGQLRVPAPVTFPPQQVGTQSAPVTLTVTNIGASAVAVSSVTPSNPSEFPGSTNCVSNVAPGASCQITIAFRPSAVGVRSLTVTIVSDGVGSPQSFAVSGTGSTGTAVVDLNQHGLTGSWYEPATSGQGFAVEMIPNQSPGNGLAFVSWFTFDTVSGGAERQRWYTLQGPVVTGQPNASLTIYQNTGGNFNAPPATNAQAVGTATLSFDTCYQRGAVVQLHRRFRPHRHGTVDAPAAERDLLGHDPASHQCGLRSFRELVRW